MDSSFNAGTPVTVGNSFASSSAAYDSTLSVAGDGAVTPVGQTRAVTHRWSRT